MKKYLLLLLSGVISFSASNAQDIPTDNPYLSFYPEYANLKHWTEEIKWDNVFNIQDYAGTGSTWDERYINARNAVANAGGGVLYFPALPATELGRDSFYVFNDDLLLVSNVVLRGVKPETYATNPNNGFSSKTVLQFPRYLFVAGCEVCAPNSSAFKKITLQNRTGENTGLVNLEVNRARIELIPTYGDVPGFTTLQPTSTVRNMIVFGVRSNNAAQPDPRVPTNSQNTFQRWSWRFAANILVDVKENAVVCNNRLNDLNNNQIRPVSSDNFPQPNYLVTGSDVLNRSVTADEATFDYLAKYSIFVNRFKKVTDTSETGYASNSTPETEPGVFAKGIDVSDNWIFRTIRPAIQANGLGITIRNNVIKDTPNKKVVINLTGNAVQTNLEATYECRGIDFGGWGCVVENNDMEVYRVEIREGNFSGDGEGLVLKGDGGSNSVPKDIVIRGNKVRTSTVFERKGRMNGFERIHAAENILVENNDFGGMPFFMDGQSDGSGCRIYHTQQNITIRNNTGMSPSRDFNLGIQARASRGGFNNVISGNTGSGILLASCNHYTISGNTGFTTAECVPIAECIENPGNEFCMPQINLIGSDSTIRSAAKDATVNVKFITNKLQTYDFNDFSSPAYLNCTPSFDSVYLYVDNKVVASIPGNNPGGVLSWSGDTAIYAFTPADTGIFRLYASVISRQPLDTVQVNSQAVRYVVGLPIEDVKAAEVMKNCNQDPTMPRCEDKVGIAKGINISNEMLLFPNPASGTVYLQVKSETTELGAVRIYDNVGRVLYSTEVYKSGVLLKEIDLTSLKPGMYFVEYTSGGKRGSKILIKE